MLRRLLHTIALLVLVACEAPDAVTPMEADGTRVGGPARSIFGRVHDTVDANRAVHGARLRVGDVEATSDLTGAYRLQAPAAEAVLHVDATEQGWTPHVVHLSPHPGPLEVWAGLLPLEETHRALAVMSATSGIAATLQEDRTYVVTTVRHVDLLLGYTPGAKVSVLADGERVPHMYPMRWNDALSACLPARAPDEGPAVSDPACGSIVVVPEVPRGAEVRLVFEHPTQLCAHGKEQRLTGETDSVVAYTIQPVPGVLNVAGVECEDP